MRAASFTTSLALVIVFRIEIDRPEKLDGLELPTTLNVFTEGRVDGRLLGLLAANPLCLGKQFFADPEVRGHGSF
jgi:hypothetical protein